MRGVAGGIRESAPNHFPDRPAFLCGACHFGRRAFRTILEARKVNVKTDQPMRALAEANGTGPHELYAVIRDGLK